MTNAISIILPARNEAASLRTLLPKIQARVPNAEVIVVNDGSDDDTLTVCEEFQVRVISHPYPKGNGAAVKSGARAAENDVLIFMDADGQHKPEDIPRLLERFNEGYDMVSEHAPAAPRPACIGPWPTISSAGLPPGWCSNPCGPDLGFPGRQSRQVPQVSVPPAKWLFLPDHHYHELFPRWLRRRLHTYRHATALDREEPYSADARWRQVPADHHQGRHALLTAEIIYSISAAFFWTGLCYYLYTYLTAGRFTNMSALLFISAIFTFLIGIVSEQISALHYKDIDQSKREGNY